MYVFEGIQNKTAFSQHAQYACLCFYKKTCQINHSNKDHNVYSREPAPVTEDKKFWQVGGKGNKYSFIFSKTFSSVRVADFF